MQYPINNINLTQHQAEVLLKVHNAATPHLAKAETENGEKAIAASKLLQDLEAISIDAEGAEITNSGMDILKAEGYLDDAGVMTQAAEELAGADGENTMNPPEDTPSEPSPDAEDLELDDDIFDQDFDAEDGDDDELSDEEFDKLMASKDWDLIKDTQNKVQLTEIIKKF